MIYNIRYARGTTLALVHKQSSRSLTEKVLSALVDTTIREGTAKKEDAFEAKNRTYSI